MKKILIILLLTILLITPSSFGAVNILSGIYDVKFQKGTSTVVFTPEYNLPNIVMIGRGNTVDLDGGNWVFDLQNIQETDLVFSSDRFNYNSEDIFNLTGYYDDNQYEFNFIKWNTGKPRLRLVEAYQSNIPELSHFSLYIGLLVALLVAKRKKA